MPGPPRRIGVASNFVEHTSLSHLYTSTAVFSSTSAILAASVTGYSRDHQYIKINYFCSVRCDFEKKLWSLMDFRPLYRRHHQLTPSLASFLGLCSIGTPHLKHNNTRIYSFDMHVQCFCYLEQDFVLARSPLVRK